MTRAAVLALCLLLAACTTSGSGGSQGSDNDKSSGFYGGLSGGWTQP